MDVPRFMQFARNYTALRKDKKRVCGNLPFHIQRNTIALSATVWTEVMVSFKRIFKTKWFAKAAKKMGIRDSELRQAIDELMQGQADNLG